MNSLTIRQFMNWQNLLAVIVSLVAMLALPASASHLVLALNNAQPTNEIGTVFFAAREAPHSAGDPDRFKIKGDLWIDNNGSADLEMAGYTISFPGTGIPSFSGLPLKGSALPVGGPPLRVVLNHDFSMEFPVPLPSQIAFSVDFVGTGETFDVGYLLDFYDNATAVGSHIFPMSVDDLAAGESWHYWNRHVDQGSSGRDRYAYDFNVVQWYNGSYITVGLDSNNNPLDGTQNDHFLAFGEPLYAVADGTVVLCTRGVADNVPPDNADPNGGGGNELWIQHGDEVIRYSHFKKDTMISRLCPTADGTSRDIEAMNIQVDAGEQIGETGNTGQSDGPHLHTSVHYRPDTTQPLDSSFETSDARPFNFHNIRIASHPTSVNSLGENPAFRAIHGRIPPSQTLIIPNLCGLDFPGTGFVEFSRHGIDAECYQDIFNLIVSRGYRPVFVDGYNVGSATYFNATFRPAGPASIARHGLTGAEYQTLFDNLTGSGFRLHQVDSYLDGGNVRYAAIFEIRPGPNFAAFHGLDDSDYAVKVDDLAADGFVPINVSAVTVGGLQYWTGLFEQLPTNSWTIETVTVGDYQDTFDANDAAGRSLIYVHGFTISGGPYLTGIWVDPVGGSTSADHGLSSAEYQTAFDTNLAAGRYTRYTTGYDDGAGNTRFAAVWRGRPGTSLTLTPAAQTNLTSATFGFAANNPFTTLECRLDGATYSPCTSTSTIHGLSEGYHTFRVRAVDRELLQDLSPAAFNWVVDVTPPMIDIVAPGVDTKTVHGVLKEDEEVDMTTVVGWADVVADVSDNLTGVARVQFKVNSIPVAGVMVDADTWKFQFVPDQNGENGYLVEVVATDGVGNSSTSSIEILATKTGKMP